MPTPLLLVINPWSTSTKISIFDWEKELYTKNLTHHSEELKNFSHITEQFAFRKALIVQAVEEAGFRLTSFRGIIWRGGLLKPIPSGVYEVNEKMLQDLINPETKEHASNLWALIAYDLAQEIPGAKAYIADPVVVDEMDDLARVSWHPLFERRSIFHALNQKAIARQYAKEHDQAYEKLNLIVVHMGGGVSIGAHKKGRVVDVNQALGGEGPFSPERSGTLPVDDVICLCFSGKYSEKEMMDIVKGKGGLVGFLGTNNAYEAELQAKAGDQKAEFIFRAFTYQVSKAIGALVPVLDCAVDAILLTWGMAKSEWICSLITSRVEKLAPVYRYPWEDEMRALALNGRAVLEGERVSKQYE